MKYLASQIAIAVGGDLVGPDIELSGATQDSREVLPGNLFIPLISQRDGHDFIKEALEAGAGAYITSKEPGPGTCIRVIDTSFALVSLGATVRGSLSCPVVGITGSVGKTSVKDMVATILKPLGSVHASLRSFNNQIGVPLTLLNAPTNSAAVIVELGARMEGDIKKLCDITRPDLGVVTTVGAAHTEIFGSIETIVRAKGELLEKLPVTGCAVLNADIPEVIGMANRTRAPVLTFGERGEVRARLVTLDDQLRPSFRLESPWGREEVKLNARGAHMVSNALAASAVGLFLGLTLNELSENLSQVQLSPWRMEIKTTSSGFVVINDTYNANPVSMTAALDSLAELPGNGRRVAVLGLMAELGGYTKEAHALIASQAKALGIEIISIGTEEYGTRVVENIEEALLVISEAELGIGDALLVKGSRVAHLEKLVQKILEN